MSGTTAGTMERGAAAPARRRATLATACGTHMLHDGFSDVIYLFLPLWQAEFALSLTQVGIVKSCYSGVMALGQVPAGLLAERLGERTLLAIGTGVTGLGFLALGFSGGFLALLALLSLAGLGSATQHPLSSSIVSRAFDGRGLRAALGIYNFSGDIGKAVVPVLAALVVGAFGWRWATGGYGAVGLAAALTILLLLAMLQAGGAPLRAPGSSNPAMRGDGGWGIRHRSGFATLASIAVVDGASRTAFLTFLPFLLIGKGAGVATVGVSLALTFVGGATGKFLCGVLAERFGIIRTTILTEAMTAAGVLAVLMLPLIPSMALLPLIGAALNGTSSVLYGTVADFVAPERRGRGFGLFYTVGSGGSAIAPSAFGLVSDSFGLTAMLLCLTVFIALTLPLALALRRPLADVARIA
jgi:MFS transporter, FSR family, fosmidomycin resistance protein